KLYVVLGKEGRQPLFDSAIEIIRTASLADLVAKLKIGRFDGVDKDDDDTADKEPAAKIVNVNPR
ncbi:MAG: hypothetical protein FWC86_03935, partial [Coriobacteriia bacterium]|nr:hypothetical protein [Coriobacteriia bacterium]